MFEYIKGTLIEADTQKAIVDVNGIGYKVFIPSCIYTDLLNLKDVFLYLSYIVKEDSQTLYGFLTKLQREIFLLLTTVSGVGPKTAILLLGNLNVENLYLAISNADVKSICQAPGIGKKTAERLIVELKDKFKNLDKKYIDLYVSKPSSLAMDAIAALMNLGYNSTQARKAVKLVLDSSDDKLELSSLITLALKNI
jgi:holliday junction DNA helicase RuvA